MNAVISALPFTAALRQRHIIILMLSAIGHGVLLAQPWPTLSRHEDYAPRALSVSIARKMAVPVHTFKPASRTSQPVTQYRADAEPPTVLEQPETVQTSVSTEQDNEPAQPASNLPDREPDYRASYLDNPQPEYPLAARRMGWQGRVVLNVEVLADGSPGEVVVQQSSGRGVLDNAAQRAVRGWRFVPARRAGQAIAQKFLVPVIFSLK